jgi:hypothetical protein
MTAPTTVDRKTTTRAQTPTLQLLTRLAVAFARRRAYPGAHPLVRTAESQAYEALTAALAERTTLTFSIGKDELLVGDVPVEGSGDVARDFSDRLRDRGIGALTFDRAVTPETLTEAIGWLALDPSGTDHRAAVSAPPSLAGVSLARIAYGRLALVDAEASAASGAASIWRALAAVSMLDDADEVTDRARVAGRDESGPLRDGAVPAGSPIDTRPLPEAEDEAVANSAPEEVARAIERRIHREGYARRVAFVLLRVAEEVAHVDGSPRGALGERLRTVLTSLRRASVGEIIKSVGVGADQRHFISQVIDALPASAIVEWLETAASATGEDLSHHLLSLMGKLAARTQSGGPVAELSVREAAVREAARDVVRGWSADAVAAARGASAVERVGRVYAAGPARAVEDHETARLVLMALEIDEFGEDARASAQQLIDQGDIAALLAWADVAPGRTAADALREMVYSPRTVTSVLLREPLDHTAARALLASLGPVAAPALLDVLRDAQSRATRRLVYDRLREFGAGLAPLLLPRLDNAPWYVVRNLLALLRDTALADGATIDTASATLFGFLSHPHEQVRVESLRLLAGDAATRDRALRRSLDDPSPRVIGVAIELLAADDGASRRSLLSPDLVRRLLRVLETTTDEEQQCRIVRALSDASPAAAVRDQLVGFTTRKTLVLRRVVLADVSSVMLAAVDVLARRYANDPKVTVILDLAKAHDDARLREAAHASTTPPRTAA